MKPILSAEARILDMAERFTELTVFNRGVYCGTLIVNTEDAEEVLRRLSGATSISQQVGTIESGANVVGVKIDKLG